MIKKDQVSAFVVAVKHVKETPSEKEEMLNLVINYVHIVIQDKF